MIKEARILKVNLLEQVNTTITTNFGSDYEAAQSGEIYRRSDGDAFTISVGSWHIKTDTLYITMYK